MDFLHTSDLHFIPDHLSETPLAECYFAVFQEIADIAIDKKIKYLLISGDMFDKPNPHTSVVLRVVKTLRVLRDYGIRVIVVPGNHDISRAKISVLHVLNEAGLLHLLDFSEEFDWLIMDPIVFEDDKLVFYGIPGFRGGSSREVKYLKDKLVKFKNEAQLRGYNKVILAHINTKFAGYDPSKYEKRYGKLYLDYEDLFRRLPENTIYVALGHIHIPIPPDHLFRGNIAYSGSPIGINIDDLIETYQLRSKDVHRRVLYVDTSTTPPSITAIKLENIPLVHYARLSIKDINDLKNQVLKLINEIEISKYTVLIIDAVGLDRLSSELEQFTREVLRKKNILLVIRSFSTSLMLIQHNGNINIPASSLDWSISEIEDTVLRIFIEKNKVKTSVEKLKQIIDKLGSSDQPPEILLREILKDIGD
ncbi:MAG: metallophosphoesterase [Desulfurococcaceae archaeon]